MHVKLQVTKQFGLSKSLDYAFQLVYISTNLFSSFEFENGLGVLQIEDTGEYSPSEYQQLLAYFLDLIEYFTHERIHLIQDPIDHSRYAIIGLPIGG